MKKIVLLALILAPVMALSFTGCATAPEDENGMPNYPVPNKADNAFKLQDANSKYLRNQY